MGLFLLIFALIRIADQDEAVLEYAQPTVLLSDLNRGEITGLEYGENALTVRLADGTEYRAAVPADRNFWSEASRQGIPLGAEPDSWLLASFGGLIPVILLLFGGVVTLSGLLWWNRRQQAKNLGGVADFRKNKARLVQPNAEKTRFADVGGAKDAREALGDVVDWLKNPQRWADAGVRPPRAVLLEGSPGNGKTLLARAVAGEAGVRFFVANATEFVEMFVGVGAARVRDLFESAQKSEPCVIFIDELDAVGRRRGSGVGLNNDEREQTLNQLLVQLDGFERGGRWVVLAATNRADVLDPALLRPGRFDMRVKVGEPDEADRLEILKVHARGRKMAEDVNLAAIAAVTEGHSGAALERIVNEASFRAMRRTHTDGLVTRQDFRDVLEKHAAEEKKFSSLDAVLVESASQLAEPLGLARAELSLDDGTMLEGRVTWASPEFIKLQVENEAEPRIVARWAIRGVRAAKATALADEAPAPPRNEADV